MAGPRKLMKILTGCVLGGSVATILLSFYTAMVTGYRYGPVTSFQTYNGILTGSAFVLAIVILAGIMTVHRIDGASRQVLRSVQEALQSDAGWSVPDARVTEAVEEVLKHTPNSPKADWLRKSVQEYEELQNLRKDIKILVTAPVGLLSAIFAISAWALPATTFLQNLYLLNTTFLFFVTYGMVVAVASVIAAVLVMLTARTVASA